MGTANCAKLDLCSMNFPRMAIKKNQIHFQRHHTSYRVVCFCWLEKTILYNIIYGFFMRIWTYDKGQNSWSLIFRTPCFSAHRLKYMFLTQKHTDRYWYTSTISKAFFERTETASSGKKIKDHQQIWINY